MHPLLISLCLGSLGLIAVLLARKPARSVFGPGPAFSLWLLPPLLALTPWLPAIPTHWSTPQAIAGLPGVRMLWVHVTANAATPTSIHWLLWIWIDGSALLGLRMLAHYIRVRRNSAEPSPHMLGELRTLMNRRDLQRVRVHSMGPAVLWSTPSQVLLPADFLDRFTPQQRRAVVAHECMHLRRGDAWWNLLAELGLAALWFNPVAWLALPRLRLDMELACDAAVLRQLPRNHAVYAQALLSNAGVDALPHLVTWLNPPQLKERLTMISRPQNSSLRRRCGYLVLTGMLTAGVFAGQAIASTQDANHSQTNNTIDLAVSGTNAVSWNNQKVSQSLLQAKLATAAARNPQPEVMIDMGPSTSFDQLYSLMHMVKQAGIAHAGFTQHGDVQSSTRNPDSHTTPTFVNPDSANRPPTQDLVWRRQHPPTYPDEAKKAKAQGLVTLSVHVDAAGAPTEVKVAQSSGHRVLDQAAVQAAEKWRFSPAVHNSEATAGWTQVKVNFTINEL